MATAMATGVDKADFEKEHKELVKEASELRNKLTNEWNKGLQRDYVVVENLLKNAKVLLSKMNGFLPVNKHGGGAEEEYQTEMILSCQLLELGARASVAKMAKEKSEDMEEFDRYLSQLKHYYFDLHIESEFMYEMLGMNLLKLLSQNLIMEFHMELELFIHENVQTVLSNPYINKAIQMEQFLTEGRYNKVLAVVTSSDESLKAEGLKSSGFRYFIERVVGNSRTGIADVIECAYERVEKPFALKSLHANEEQLRAIAKERNWELRSDGFVYFPQKNDDAATLPASKLALNAVQYAKDLDRIV